MHKKTEVGLQNEIKRKGEGMGSMLETHRENSRVAALEQEKRRKGVESSRGTLGEDWG